MFPDLFSIGPLTIHTYGLFVALGFATAITVALKAAKHLNISRHRVLDMSVLMIPAAIAGSRAMYALINWAYFESDTIAVFKIWEGGLVFSGGLTAILIILLIYAKISRQSFWFLGDFWAPGAALGTAIGWIGCFMAGSCYGKPTDSAWGIVFTDPRSLAPTHIPLFPTQLFGAAGGIILAAILFKIQAKKAFNGQVLLWFLIMHSTLSLWLSKYRGDAVTFFSGSGSGTPRLICFGFLIGAVIALIILKKQNSEK